MHDLIRASYKKTCCLDPIPTCSSSCNYQDHQLLSRAWCLSMNVEKCPGFSCILQKEGLEPIFKTYRPVSNLQFISKLTESALAKQLQHHISINNKLVPRPLFPGFGGEAPDLQSQEKAPWGRGCMNTLQYATVAIS